MNILLVRLRLIGDVIFTTPIVRALRRHYSDAHLCYLVEAPAAPVVRHNPHLDEVLAVPYRRGWRRLADDLHLAWRLRRRHFDLAIDLHGGPRSGWLTWASGATRRVGYDVAGRTWMYTHAVHRPRELRPRHSVVNQWDLLAAVDPALAAPPDQERDRVEMTPGDEARVAADRALAAIDLPAGARLVLLHVSAGNPFRRWPESAFAELASGLATGDAGRWVLITSGPSDRDAAARVVDGARRRAGAAGRRVVAVDGLDLEQLRALMDRAALYVGGDSGPLHIASTSDVPIVGLYGPTLAARSAPWRPPAIPTSSVEPGELPCRPCDQRVCAPGDFRCLTALTAPRVLEAAERLLEAAR